MIATIVFEVEVLDVGFVVSHPGAERRRYCGPSGRVAHEMLSTALEALGWRDDGVGMSGPALAPTHVEPAPVPVPVPAAVVPPAPVAEAAPAAAPSIDLADLAEPARAYEILRKFFDDSTFTTKVLADLSGGSLSACGAALTRLAEAGAVIRGERKKDGILYSCAATYPPVVPAAEEKLPEEVLETPAPAPSLEDLARECKAANRSRNDARAHLLSECPDAFGCDIEEAVTAAYGKMGPFELAAAFQAHTWANEKAEGVTAAVVADRLSGMVTNAANITTAIVSQAMGTAPAAEPEAAKPEPELDRPVVVLATEKPNEKIRKDLRNQAGVCLAAGWTREKAVQSLTRMGEGHSITDTEILDIVAEAYGTGDEPAAPF